MTIPAHVGRQHTNEMVAKYGFGLHNKDEENWIH